MSPHDFDLLETMRWEGRVALLDRHLDRLAAAAEHFGYPYDSEAIIEAIADVTRGLRETPHRLRLLVGEDGEARVEASPLEAFGPIRNALVVPAPEAAGGPFWRHKTTHRPHYESAYLAARAVGFDEAVLLDAEGFVVEGTRTTAWVRRGDALVTPPLSAGCLPGVYRAHLLDTNSDAIEAPVHRTDLLGADAVYLSNAVRGRFSVTVSAAPS